MSSQVESSPDGTVPPLDGVVSSSLPQATRPIKPSIITIMSTNDITFAMSLPFTLLVLFTIMNIVLSSRLVSANSIDTGFLTLTLI